MIGILKYELETIFIVLAMAAVTLLVMMHYKKPEQHVFVPQLPTILATPTPTTSLPTSQTVTALSPDGTKTLYLKKQPAGNITRYTLSVSDGSTGEKHPIYTTTVDNTSTFTIPFNTWSPDDKYVFLKKMTSSTTEYYVFSATGDASDPITIHDKFISHYADLVLTDVTGWAAPYLIIVNTKTVKGEQGPSFWFDISSQSFIQLSTRFN